MPLKKEEEEKEKEETNLSDEEGATNSELFHGIVSTFHSII